MSLRSRWFAIALGLGAGLAAPARAQSDAAAPTSEEEPAPAPAEPAGRSLTEEQQEQWLEQVRTDLLPKVWPERCADDEGYRRKYLRKWQAVVSDHYIVFTNGPTATCRKYAVTLESLFAKIRETLPFPEPERLLVAYIFADREDYYRYCVAISGYSPEGARRTAGHANSRYYATYYESPRAPVVYHEATHEIVGACLRVTGVGSWFQEGMAVYFEKVMTNGRLQGGARNDVRRGDSYPLREFFAIPSLLADPNGHGSRNYEHAGALVEFMMDTKLEPVAGRFGAFLEAARKGRGFGRGLAVSERLIREVYGLSIDEFEALWRRHLGVD
ncbi:MAG: hypothetical protein AB7O97_02700 [Planctomycetota bacterium]